MEVGPGEYIPGSVVGRRTDKAGQPEVLVQWEGFTGEAPTWEPLGGFLPQPIQDFLKAERLTLTLHKAKK